MNDNTNAAADLSKPFLDVKLNVAVDEPSELQHQKPQEPLSNCWADLALFMKTAGEELKGKLQKDPNQFKERDLPVMKDFIKFQSLRDMAQNPEHPQLNLPSLSSQALLIDELIVAAEEEDQPDNLSVFSKAITLSDDSSLMMSQRNSFMSQRTSFISNPSQGKKHSFLSNFSAHRASIMSNEHDIPLNYPDFDSIADFSKGQEMDFLKVPLGNSFNPLNDPKKRNSEIVASLSTKVTGAQCRRSMQEIIHRGSMQSIDLSPLKNVIVSKDIKSIGQFAEAHSDDEESEGSFEESNENLSESKDLIKSQQYLRLTLLNYEGVKFNPAITSEKSDTKELNSQNLLSYGARDEIDQAGKYASQKLHPSERRFKKMWVDKKGPNTGKLPFYVVSQDRFLKSSFREINQETVLTKKANDSPTGMYGLGKSEEDSSSSDSESGTEETVLSFGTFKFKDSRRDPRSMVYQLYWGKKHVGQESGNQSGSLDRFDNYTVTLENNTLYSHVFNAKCLKEVALEEHFQVRIDFAESRYPVNMYALVLLQYSREKQALPALPSGVLRNIASFLRENKLYIRDSGTKRGTFVKLAYNQPLLLQEGMLLSVTNKVGFYVKSLNGISEEATRLNRECDVYCLNSTPLKGEDFAGVTADSGEKIMKFMQKMRRKELRELIEKANCPHVILELVSWDNKLEFYAERGGVCVMFNDYDLKTADSNEDQQPFLKYSHKNWCYLSQIEPLEKIFKQLKVPFEPLLQYNPEDETWMIQSHLCVKDSLKETFPCESFDELGEYQFDFNSIFLGHNLRTDLVGTKGINKSKLIDKATNEGLFVCTSPLNIFQDKFEPMWVEIAPGSQVKLANTIFKLDFDSFKTISEKTNASKSIKSVLK